MIEAKELLEQINDLGGLKSYRYSNNKSYVWNIAMNLYSKHNPTAKVRKGCTSCAKSIYNWLLAHESDVKVSDDDKPSDELKSAYKEATGAKRISSSITIEEMENAIREKSI